MNSENMWVPPTALDGSLSFCAGGADAVLSLSRKVDQHSMQRAVVCIPVGYKWQCIPVGFGFKCLGNICLVDFRRRVFMSLCWLMLLLRYYNNFLLICKLMHRSRLIETFNLTCVESLKKIYGLHKLLVHGAGAHTYMMKGVLTFDFARYSPSLLSMSYQQNLLLH